MRSSKRYPVKRIRKKYKYKSYDGTLRHPFTLLISGPSGSGKSTFVDKLIRERKDLINEELDYIYIFIGTPARENQTFVDLIDSMKSQKRFQLFELNKIYNTSEKLKNNFSKDFLQMIQLHKEKGEKGCVVFDDLMEELSKSDILVSLWTKISSHYSLSVIFVTQNMFFKGGGSRSSDMVTVFRNTRYLTLFRYKLDKTIIRNVVTKIGSGKNGKNLQEMISEICKKYRYCLIRADLERDDLLQYSSDIFGFKHFLSVPFKCQRIFKPKF